MLHSLCWLMLEKTIKQKLQIRNVIKCFDFTYKNKRNYFFQNTNLNKKLNTNTIFNKKEIHSGIFLVLAQFNKTQSKTNKL